LKEIRVIHIPYGKRGKKEEKRGEKLIEK